MYITIVVIVRSYTAEAGVRNLERNIGAVCRAVAVKVTENSQSLHLPYVVTTSVIEDTLGVRIMDTVYSNRCSHICSLLLIHYPTKIVINLICHYYLRDYCKHLLYFSDQKITFPTTQGKIFIFSPVRWFNLHYA